MLLQLLHYVHVTPGSSIIKKWKRRQRCGCIKYSFFCYKYLLQTAPGFAHLEYRPHQFWNARTKGGKVPPLLQNKHLPSTFVESDTFYTSSDQAFWLDERDSLSASTQYKITALRITLSHRCLNLLRSNLTGLCSRWPQEISLANVTFSCVARYVGVGVRWPPQLHSTDCVSNMQSEEEVCGKFPHWLQRQRPHLDHRGSH